MKILLALDASFASRIAFEETTNRPWPADSSFDVINASTDEILDRAAAISADLIVAGSRDLLPNPLGAPCSIAIVRERARRIEGGLKILVAIDGSEFALQAATSVAARPWPDHSEIRVFSGLESGFRKQSAGAVAEAHKILAVTGLPVSDAVSNHAGDPGELILDEATFWAADVIVLGSHGQHSSDFSHFGSVAESVVNKADCSVEVIRL